MHLIGKKYSRNIDVDKMIYIFNKTTINTLCNFVPHEMVLFDERYPPWMKEEIKKLTYGKKNIFVSLKIITSSYLTN